MTRFKDYTPEARLNVLGGETPLAIADFFFNLDLETHGGRTQHRYRFYYGERFASPARFDHEAFAHYSEGYVVIALISDTHHPSFRFCVEHRKGGMTYGIPVPKIVLIEYAALRSVAVGEERVLYRHPHLARTHRTNGLLYLSHLAEVERLFQPPVAQQPVEETVIPKQRKLRRINIRDT
jgi:hypothetical protein